MQAQKSLRKTLSVEGAHPIRQVGTPGCHGGHRMYESRWGTFVWNRAWKNPGRQTELWRIVNTLSTHPNDRPPTARGAQRWRRAHKIFRVGDCRLQATGKNAGGACTALIALARRQHHSVVVISRSQYYLLGSSRDHEPEQLRAAGQIGKSKHCRIARLQVPATGDSKISATHCVQLRKQLGWPGLGQQDLMPTLVGMSWEAVPFRGRSSHEGVPSRRVECSHEESDFPQVDSKG